MLFTILYFFLALRFRFRGSIHNRQLRDDRDIGLHSFLIVDGLYLAHGALQTANWRASVTQRGPDFHGDLIQ